MPPMILAIQLLFLTTILAICCLGFYLREKHWNRVVVAQEQLFQKERLLYRLPNGPTINIRRWRRRERRRLRRKEQIRRR